MTSDGQRPDILRRGWIPILLHFASVIRTAIQSMMDDANELRPFSAGKKLDDEEMVSYYGMTVLVCSLTTFLKRKHSVFCATDTDDGREGRTEHGRRRRGGRRDGRTDRGRRRRRRGTAGRTDRGRTATTGRTTGRTRRDGRTEDDGDDSLSREDTPAIPVAAGHILNGIDDVVGGIGGCKSDSNEKASPVNTEIRRHANPSAANAPMTRVPDEPLNRRE